TGRPSVAAELSRTRQRVPSPQDLAGLRVQRGQTTADTELAAGDAAVDDAVVVERRAGNGVAVLPLLEGGLPRDLARFHVQGHHGRIELAKEQQPLAHRQTAVHPPAAGRGDLLVDAGPVLPQELAGLRVESEDVIITRDDVHDAVLDERRRFEGVLAAQAGALE